MFRATNDNGPKGETPEGPYWGSPLQAGPAKINSRLEREQTLELQTTLAGSFG